MSGIVLLWWNFYTWALLKFPCEAAPRFCTPRSKIALLRNRWGDVMGEGSPLESHEGGRALLHASQCGAHGHFCGTHRRCVQRFFMSVHSLEQRLSKLLWWQPTRRSTLYVSGPMGDGCWLGRMFESLGERWLVSLFSPLSDNNNSDCNISNLLGMYYVQALHVYYS